MLNIVEKIDTIKDSILKFVPAKYIYLFGSYAYGNPTEESDIDLLLSTESVFNSRKEKNVFKKQ